MAKEKMEIDLGPKINFAALKRFDNLATSLEAKAKAISKYGGDTRGIQAQIDLATKKARSLAGAGYNTGRSTTGITTGLGSQIAGHGETLGHRFGLGQAIGGAKDIHAGVESGEMGAAGAVLAGVGVSLLAAVGAAKAFSAEMNKVAGLVGTHSPAALKRFEDTWEDIYGVLGNRLEPLLALWTDELRLLGDVLQSVLPSQAQMKATIDEYRPALAAVKQALKELAPLIQATLVYGLMQAAKAVSFFATVLSGLILYIKEMTPAGWLFKEDAPNLKSNFGMGGRGASIVSGETLAQNAIIAAMQSGTSPEEITAQTVQEILAYLREHPEDVGTERDPRNTPRRFT